MLGAYLHGVKSKHCSFSRTPHPRPCTLRMDSKILLDRVILGTRTLNLLSSCSGENASLLASSQGQCCPLLKKKKPYPVTPAVQALLCGI